MFALVQTRRAQAWYGTICCAELVQSSSTARPCPQAGLVLYHARGAVVQWSNTWRCSTRARALVQYLVQYHVRVW